MTIPPEWRPSMAARFGMTPPIVPPGVDAVYGAPLAGVPVYECPQSAAPMLALAHQRVHGRAAVVHTGDGSIPTPPAVEGAGWQEPSDEAIERMQPATRIVVLAGPGVVRSGAVPGIHALATAGSLGVLNTWGAKGIFDWRS